MQRKQQMINLKSQKGFYLMDRTITYQRVCYMSETFLAKRKNTMRLRR